MIIGKKRLKQIKQLIVSPIFEKLTLLFYLVILPILVMYDQIALVNHPLNLQSIRSYFAFNKFEQSNTTESVFNYLQTIYIPKYYSRGFHANHIPISQLVIAQQRIQDVRCLSDYMDCYYLNTNQTEVKTFANQSELCIEENCLDFQQKPTLLSGMYITGHYSDYSHFDYYFTIDINSNLSQTFDTIKSNGWINNGTEALALFGSIYELQSGLQVELVMLIEMNEATQALYNKELIFQLPFYDLNDQLHLSLFIILIILALLRVFRTLLELTYIFSRYNFLFQLFNFISMIIFVISKLQILIARSEPQINYLLFPQKLLSKYFDGTVLQLQTAIEVQNYQIIEDVGKLLLLLGYPYSFLQFILLYINANWVQSFHCITMRTLPTLIITMFLCNLVYYATYLPFTLFDIQQRTSNYSSRYLLYIFTKIFIQDTFKGTPNLFTKVIIAGQFAFEILIAIYVIALSIEAFRKSSILEMPYQSKYEKDYQIAYESLNIKIKKVLKQMFNKYINKKSEKKLQTSKSRPSQILDDDDELNSELEERVPSKILIVFEIHTQFLEEINRFKAKKENNLYSTKKVIKKPAANAGQKIGSIISQLLQRNKQNSRLQVMLKRFHNDPQPQEEPEQQDFFNSYGETITESGVTIRSFLIMDQVIQFLQMLLKLKPEFLSLNAEQRIRILFYINSDQVEEEDVYKLLSFLIVSLQKYHLHYPILVFSYHKEWYIEKSQYLNLKKNYRNIFSTLDMECALDFCLMKTSFLNFEIRFSKDQQFYEKEIEDISNSMIEEENEKSVLL